MLSFVAYSFDVIIVNLDFETTRTKIQGVDGAARFLTVCEMFEIQQMITSSWIPRCLVVLILLSVVYATVNSAFRCVWFLQLS